MSVRLPSQMSPPAPCRSGVVARQVQQIVLDLEGGAEEEPEAQEAVQVARPRCRSARRRGRDRSSCTSRSSSAPSPGSRLARSQRVVAPPAELDRLALDRSRAPCARPPRGCGSVSRGPRSRGCRSAARRPSSVSASPTLTATGTPCIRAASGGRAVPRSRPRRRRGPETRCAAAPARPPSGRRPRSWRRRRGRSRCRGWPQHPPAAARVVGDEVVEVALRLARAQVVRRARRGSAAVFLQQSRTRCRGARASGAHSCDAGRSRCRAAGRLCLVHDQPAVDARRLAVGDAKAHRQPIAVHDRDLANPRAAPSRERSSCTTSGSGRDRCELERDAARLLDAGRATAPDGTSPRVSFGVTVAPGRGRTRAPARWHGGRDERPAVPGRWRRRGRPRHRSRHAMANCRNSNQRREVRGVLGHAVRQLLGSARLTAAPGRSTDRLVPASGPGECTRRSRGSRARTPRHHVARRAARCWRRLPGAARHGRGR